MHKTHKLRSQNGSFAFSECNIPLHIQGGEASPHWDDVDCKKCLKARETKSFRQKL